MLVEHRYLTVSMYQIQGPFTKDMYTASEILNPSNDEISICLKSFTKAWEKFPLKSLNVP